MFSSSIVEESAAGGSSAAADAERENEQDVVADAAAGATRVDQSSETGSIVQTSKLDSGTLGSGSPVVSVASTISGLDLDSLHKPGVGGGEGWGNQEVNGATGRRPFKTFTPDPMNLYQQPRTEGPEYSQGVYGGNQQRSSWSGLRSTPVAPQPGSVYQNTDRPQYPPYTPYMNDVRRGNLYDSEVNNNNYNNNNGYHARPLHPSYQNRESLEDYDGRMVYSDDVLSSLRNEHLPKIEYRKLTQLTLKNFNEFCESISKVGYSRKWPEMFYSPDPNFLKTYNFKQDKSEPRYRVFDDKRREAYLVLCNCIPFDLKYLIRKVEVGDVLGTWAELFNRFRHVTSFTIKQLTGEWNSLSMDSTGLFVDEFISHVVKKSKHLKSMGVHISDEDEAITLLDGLSRSYNWLKNHCRVDPNFTFDSIAKLALDFASDNHLLKTGQTTLSESKKKTGSILNINGKKDRYCFAFNSEKGCSNPSCTWPHKINPDKGVVSHVGAPPPERRKSLCWHCNKPGHKAVDCKSRIAGEQKVVANINNESKDVDEKKNRRSNRNRNRERKSEGDQDVPNAFAFSIRENASEVVESEDHMQHWYFDGGSTHHFTNNFWDLVNPRQIPTKTFQVANTTELRVSYVGHVVFGSVTIHQVYFCPTMPLKLISESRLLSKGADILKNSETQTVDVLFSKFQVLGGAMLGGLFKLTSYRTEKGMKTISISENRIVCSTVHFDRERLFLFHKQVGHLNFDSCLKMLDMEKGPVPVCESCNLAKLNRLKIPKNTDTRASRPLYRIFADLSGRKCASLSGLRYYLLLIDDYSRRRWVFLLKKKSEALQNIKDFVKSVERSHPDYKISQFRSDGGGEFVSIYREQSIFQEYGY